MPLIKIKSRSKPKTDAQRLREWRKATGFSQREVGEILHCTSQTVYNYERENKADGRFKVPHTVWVTLNAIHPVSPA